MRIAVDAAGREPGLRVVVQGVMDALGTAPGSEVQFRPVLYGPETELRQALEELDVPSDAVDIVDAPEVIEMDDLPHEALTSKPNSSIVRATKDLSAGLVDAFVSMGNTGAVVGACRAFVDRLRWINKPALGVPLPRKKGMGFMVDVGATPDPKSGHMLQFAAMGSAFVERVYGINEPRVGLLNIGTESHKGDERSRDVYKLLQRSPLNFIGNIEGGDIFEDRADVIVTTGFVGNVLLKFTEAIPGMLQDRLTGTGLSVTGDGALADLDYRRYGGATLLGVDGTVVIGHGRSTAGAVARAMRWASKMVHGHAVEAIRDCVFKTRRAVWLSNPFARGETIDEP
ncbi:phosphate acyltransferase [bacterium]|nr:phosphate acyltransferase [bacterium]